MDYKHIGFNSRTKIIQLWDGISLEDYRYCEEMQKDEFIKAEELIIDDEDNFIVGIKKRIKRLFYEPLIEPYYKYFVMVVANKQMMRNFSQLFHLPERNFLISGAARNNVVIDLKDKKTIKKILYAPAIRKNELNQQKIINYFIDNCNHIQNYMAELNCELVLYLTYELKRKYCYQIEEKIKEMNLISLLNTSDIYDELPLFDVLITDYSSIMFDFLHWDKPIVFLCPDKENYLRLSHLEYDYDIYTPGQKASEWLTALEVVKKCLANPKKDEEWRKKVKSFFFEEGTDDENNCKRIVEEILRRI